MTRSPAGRRAPRAGGPGPDEWLEVPGWRRPVDTLLVLAVTFATAWVGLVVIPAAAHSDSTQVQNPTPHTQNDAAPPTAGPSQDPSQWFAGPVYTGEPAAPTVEQVVAEAPPVVVAAPRTAAHRTTPRRTTTHAAPRTSAKAPAATTTVAAVVAAAVTTPPVVTTAATTTPPATTTSDTTTSDTTTSSSTTTETTTPSTSTSVPPAN